MNSARPDEFTLQKDSQGVIGNQENGKIYIYLKKAQFISPCTILGKVS